MRKIFIVNSDTNIPEFISIAAIALGCLGLLRGFMHTILLDIAATNIAGFDLSTSLDRGFAPNAGHAGSYTGCLWYRNGCH